MGRSVSYPSAARVVTFRHLDWEDEDDSEWLWDFTVSEFQRCLKAMFPSVEPADDWIGREDHVLAENKLARFGMSEYCGLVAYWIVPQQPLDQYGNYNAGLDRMAERWIDSIADKFVAAFGELTKVGSMSNGEGVYRQIRKGE
jgi:hypothetical protein